MSRLTRFVPILDWGRAYSRRDLPGDLMAGSITAIMLVPQAMAYAMLAGLPPEVGLYASIAPPILYGIFGSSRALAVGPVAIASLMTATALSALSPAGSPDYIANALVLSLLIGLMLLGLGIARAGFLVNFLSHPVIAGFTSAASILIVISQLKHLLGIDIPRGESVATLVNLARGLSGANGVTLAISACSLVILLAMRAPLTALLQRLRLSPFTVQLLTRSSPLLVVILSVVVTSAWRLDESAGVAIVGAIPSGLPSFTVPSLDLGIWQALLPSAALIAFVSYLESVSVAKALAARKRQKVDADQELIGLGAANLAAAFTGASPVAGGFARSMVNFAAGANTPLASILTALLLAISVMFFTPFFHYLPQAVLAATIVVAVVALIDGASFVRTWHYNKADFAAQAGTFMVVLGIGVEAGIMTGIVLSLTLYLWRSSRPHFAIVGQVDNSEHYRNVKRHHVRTDPAILLFRIDENLYFPNAGYLEEHLRAEVAANPEVRHVVLICSSVSLIDASALETLTELRDTLRAADVTLHLAEVKGPVMDRLQATDFTRDLAPGRIFLSTHDAVRTLRERLYADSYAADI
ncbi:sulfate permease [Iodidimonas sp. SYSU 1G8]|uniref:SulP family inorganic anion transporter n=1 Tax=Iodidimonas sp. SYSU 1G8 TaxID=3133967 RepID=UPI0031FEAF09